MLKKNYKKCYISPVFASLNLSLSLGFSLLELMIVIVIIGILATVAIPSYQRYAYRAKFTEVVQATLPFKLAVEICAHESNDLQPCTQGNAGIPAEINNPDTDLGYVKNITVKQGVITAISQHIGNKNYNYIFVPTKQASGQIYWSIDKSSSCITENLC